ncbi:MAG: class I SAM-dependent methyltransferase [Chloroflexi bacterium]|nr:class I SAM-dependent methyltransferase [Chloroflexota bacterium]
MIDYQGTRWREEFWPGREFEDLAERRALTRLLPPRGEVLVDIGAGFGRLADLYRGYKRVILLDPAKSQLQAAQDLLSGDPRFILATGDIYRLPLADAAFDTAVTVRVLHHLRDIPRALAEVQRILKPQGTFILEYPNKRNLKEILRWLLGRSQKRPFSREPVEFVPGNLNFHPAYMAQALAHAQLGIERELAVSHFRSPLLKRLFPASTLATLDGLLQVPGGRVKLSPSVFVAARPSNSGRAIPDSPGASLFQCPYDRRGELSQNGETLSCAYCGRTWEPEDGIYNFLVESNK